MDNKDDRVMARISNTFFILDYFFSVYYGQFHYFLIAEVGSTETKNRLRFKSSNVIPGNGMSHEQEVTVA